MRFDLHVHSCFSKDSNSDIDSILLHAVKNGMDGIALCDHNTVEGSFVAAERVNELELDLMIIPSVEVSSAEGHILVLGITESINAHMSAEKTIEKARELGGTIIIPHPFKKISHGLGYIEGIDIDAVEVINSRSLTSSSNIKALNAARSLNIPGVGGSDAHIPQMVGRSYTDIDAKSSTVESVLSAIKEGRIQAGGSLTPTHIVVKQMFSGVERLFRRRLIG